MTFKRREFMGLAGAAAMMPMLARAQGSGRMVLGSWGGIWENTLRTMMPAIQSGTGLDVELAIGGSQVTLSKLLAAKDNSPFDAALMTCEAQLAAHDEGALLTLTEETFPELAMIQPSLLEPFKVDGGYCGLPFHWKASGILWRKDLVPFEITSWADLWRPELKNRVSIQNMPTMGGARTLITAAVINGGSQFDLEPGWEAMKELRPNIREFFSVSSNAMTSLANGDTWATVNVLGLGTPLADRGVVQTVPTEGVGISGEGICFPKTAANTEAAMAFARFMLQPEQQLEWAKNALVAPSTTVEIPAALAETMVETPAMLDNVIAVDFPDMAKNMAAWSDRWRKEVVG